jgi:hypothetical protein
MRPPRACPRSTASCFLAQCSSGAPRAAALPGAASRLATARP